MSTTFQERLETLQVDEGLLGLIASQVPQEQKPAQAGPEGMGLQLVQFLEEKPDCAREAARAVHLPREVREVIARKLAEEFLGRAKTLPSKVSPADVADSPPAPGIIEVPGQDNARSPYRVVFGCRYERPQTTSAPKETPKKGGD